jgi:multidrug resistance efflux pump
MASGGAQLGRKVAGVILAAAVYAITILLALYVTRIYLDYPQTDDAYVRADTREDVPHLPSSLVARAIEEQVRGDELVQGGAGGGIAPAEIDQVVVE